MKAASPPVIALKNGTAGAAKSRAVIPTLHGRGPVPHDNRVPGIECAEGESVAHAPRLRRATPNDVSGAVDGGAIAPSSTRIESCESTHFPDFVTYIAVPTGEETVVSKHARSGPNVCGIDAALDVVSGKWRGLSLWSSAYGTRRFAELRRGLHGVSEKMLTQQLRQMEQDGLIHRELHPEVPPKVEYTLTVAGGALNDALRPLGESGSERMRQGDLRRAP